LSLYAVRRQRTTLANAPARRPNYGQEIGPP